jgi:hypothetical protein
MKKYIHCNRLTVSHRLTPSHSKTNPSYLVVSPSHSLFNRVRRETKTGRV